MTVLWWAYSLCKVFRRIGLLESLAREFGVKDISAFARAISHLESLIYSATVLSSVILSVVEHGMECNRDQLACQNCWVAIVCHERCLNQAEDVQIIHQLTSVAVPGTLGNHTWLWLCLFCFCIQGFFKEG